eukprot:7795260-Pyramimonas_sp.AAC.1
MFTRVFQESRGDIIRNIGVEVILQGLVHIVQPHVIRPKSLGEGGTLTTSLNDQTENVSIHSSRQASVSLERGVQESLHMHCLGQVLGADE